MPSFFGPRAHGYLLDIRKLYDIQLYGDSIKPIERCYFLSSESLHKLPVLQVGSLTERAPVGRFPGARTRR